MGTNDAHSSWTLTSVSLFKKLAISFSVLDPRATPDSHMHPALNTNGNTMDSIAFKFVLTHPQHPPQEPEVVITRIIMQPPCRNHELIPTGMYTRPLRPLCTRVPHSPICFILRDLVTQIGWCNESHRKCCCKTIQGSNGCDFIIRVRRDTTGNLTTTGNTIKDSPVNISV